MLFLRCIRKIFQLLTHLKVHCSIGQINISVNTYFCFLIFLSRYEVLHVYKQEETHSRSVAPWIRFKNFFSTHPTKLLGMVKYTRILSIRLVNAGLISLRPNSFFTSSFSSSTSYKELMDTAHT